MVTLATFHHPGSAAPTFTGGSCSPRRAGTSQGHTARIIRNPGCFLCLHGALTLLPEAGSLRWEQSALGPQKPPPTLPHARERGCTSDLCPTHHFAFGKTSREVEAREQGDKRSWASATSTFATLCDRPFPVTHHTSPGPQHRTRTQTRRLPPQCSFLPAPRPPP